MVTLNVCAALAACGLVVAGATHVRASDFWDGVRSPGLAAARRAIAAGRDALARNRVAEALESAESAIGTCPKCVDAYTLRGRALTVLGRNGEALASFEQARALASDALLEAEVARTAASSALSVGRADFAIAVLSAASPGDDAAARDRGALMLADAYQASGPTGLEHARALYRAVSPSEDLSAGLLLSTALALHRSGEIEAALAMARRLQTQEAERAANPAWLPTYERAARSALYLTAIGDLVAATGMWSAAGDGGGAWNDHARRERTRLQTGGKP